jgi:hypothetical protein
MNDNKKTDINLHRFNLLNFININKVNIFDLIKKQIFNLNNKRRILRWKLKKTSYINWINNSKNLATKRSLKRLFVSFPYIKHTNNNVNLLLFIFNKNKTALKNKISKLNTLILKKKLMVFNNTNLFQISTNVDIFNFKNNIVRLIKYKKISYILKRNFLANIYLNKFKFNKLNLINLKNIIYKIYVKKVNINIINIKYLYLENNILVDALTRKLNDRKKRVLRVLKKTLKLVKLATFIDYEKLSVNINKYMFNILNINKKNVYKEIINNLNNKHIVGMFLEAKGRLTRRMTASRAVYKLKYKGNMKDANLNLDSKFTILKRGYIKSNIVYSTNNSYNKNGSFGVSSKVNTY